MFNAFFVYTMFIDTHTHLYSDAFESDRSEMIQRALDAGVQKLLLPNIDLASLEGMYDLEKKYPQTCFAMLGLHPTSVEKNWEEQLHTLHIELEKRPFIAIGEIGIDLYWDKSLLAEQQYAFRAQIEWAKERQLPIVIHARDSFPEIYAILDEVNDERLRGVFHCFTGNEQDVAKIQSYGGFYFGIGGVVTFKKAGLDAVLPHIPVDRLLLETDSPYLAPTPHRGKRNESAYIPLIAEKISDVLAVSVEKVAEWTTSNAQQLFKF